MQRTMRALRVLGGLILASLVGATWTHRSSLGQTGAAEGSAQRGPERPPLDITLNEVRLRIPRAYVFAAFPGDRGLVDLSVLAESFDPYTAQTAPNFPRDFLRMGVTILIDSAGDTPAYGRDAALPGLRQSLQLRTRASVAAGEEIVPAVILDHGVVPGLRMLRATRQPNSGGTPRDRFLPLEAQEDNAVEAIFCVSPLSESGLPERRRFGLQCEHSFVFKRLLITLRYSHHWLPRWEQLRDRTLSLLAQWSAPDTLR